MAGVSRRPSHKPIGNAGSGEFASRIPHPHSVITCPPIFGQHNSSVLPEKGGGGALRPSYRGDGADSLLVSETSRNVIHYVHSRETEREDRLSVEVGGSDLDGVVVATGGSGQSPELLATATDRPIRRLSECKTPDICQPVFGHARVGHGRADIGLGRVQRLRVSSLSPSRESAAQDFGNGKLRNDDSRLLLAVSELVSEPLVSPGSFAGQTASLGQYRQPTRSPGSQEFSMVSASRGESIQRVLHNRGFSKDVASYVVQSTRQSFQQCNSEICFKRFDS